MYQEFHGRPNQGLKVSISLLINSFVKIGASIEKMFTKIGVQNRPKIVQKCPPGGPQGIPGGSRGHSGRSPGLRGELPRRSGDKRGNLQNFWRVTGVSRGRFWGPAGTQKSAKNRLVAEKVASEKVQRSVFHQFWVSSLFRVDFCIDFLLFFERFLHVFCVIFPTFFVTFFVPNSACFW